MANNKIIKSDIRKYDIASVADTKRMAIVLKKHIVDNNLYAEIAKKNYVMVEGWQFAGGLLGLSPIIKSVKEISKNKWLAKAVIIERKTGNEVGVGYALCSKEESKKSSFDEYAILSMAQTRAIGKAFRNLIGWVMKLAGYEPTPAEEIKASSSTKPISVVDVNKKIDKIETRVKAMDMKCWIDENEKNYTEVQVNVMLRRLEEHIKTLKK